MTILKTFGWLVVLLPLTILLYNIPVSMLVSLYSKIRYGYVRLYPKMPGLLVMLGIGATWVLASVLAALFDADSRALRYAAAIRSGIYALFRY